MIYSRYRAFFLLLLGMLGMGSYVKALSAPLLYGIPGSGWASPNWNWGYAVGTGHDCAMRCRDEFRTPLAREALVDNLLQGSSDSIPFEHVKLVLALVLQKANRMKPWGGQAEVAYARILDAMVEANRYEDGDDESCSRCLVQDLQKCFVWLEPTVDDKIAMNMLWYDSHDDFDLARRKCLGLTLKAMKFIDFGL